MRIICAGMRRSASTWQYNAARIICATQGEVRACFEDAYELGAVVHEIIKTHRYEEKLLFGADVVLTIHRDPRDVAASAVRRGLCEDRPVEVVRFLTKAITDEYDRWSGKATLVQRYAEVMEDKPAAVGLIANILDIPIEPALVSRLVEALPVQRAPDPEILLHEDHFTDGRTGTWDSTLCAESIHAIQSVFGEWMNERGYKL